MEARGIILGVCSRPAPLSDLWVLRTSRTSPTSHTSRHIPLRKILFHPIRWHAPQSIRAKQFHGYGFARSEAPQATWQSQMFLIESHFWQLHHSLSHHTGFLAVAAAAAAVAASISPTLRRGQLSTKQQHQDLD